MDVLTVIIVAWALFASVASWHWRAVARQGDEDFKRVSEMYHDACRQRDELWREQGEQRKRDSQWDA